MCSLTGSPCPFTFKPLARPGYGEVKSCNAGKPRNRGVPARYLSLHTGVVHPQGKNPDTRCLSGSSPPSPEIPSASQNRSSILIGPEIWNAASAAIPTRVIMPTQRVSTLLLCLHRSWPFTFQHIRPYPQDVGDYHSSDDRFDDRNAHINAGKEGETCKDL